MATPVLQTATRKLGKTEANWVAVVNTGTGVTISSILFDRRVPAIDLEEALREVLGMNPRLRSVVTLGQGDKKLCFETPDNVSVTVPVIPSRFDSLLQSKDGSEDFGSEIREPWHLITEEELNVPFPREYPFPVFECKLYLLPDSNCLFILRLHAAAADMASTSTAIEQIVGALHRRSIATTEIPKTDTKVEVVSKKLEDAPVLRNPKLLATTGCKMDSHLPSIESVVPPGEAKKPFWAHGVDVVGYGLGSRRHSYLPFQDTASPRNSKLIRAALTAEATNLLLKECEKRSVSLGGAINAAGLKAVAAVKQLGAKEENFGTAVLLQCRHRLQPTLPDSTIGFYHSAMLRTMSSSESMPFWDLATKCATDFAKAIQSRKHFTDMGDLNALMMQAVRFTNLTPSGSLRTAMLSMTFDPVVENVGSAGAALGIKDYMSCSSVHGVGPCLGIFSFMRQSSLQFSFVYPAPLFSRSQMQKLVDHILNYLSVDSDINHSVAGMQ